jgi:hypothetical protein
VAQETELERLIVRLGFDDSQYREGMLQAAAATASLEDASDNVQKAQEDTKNTFEDTSTAMEEVTHQTAGTSRSLRFFAMETQRAGAMVGAFNPQLGMTVMGVGALSTEIGQAVQGMKAYHMMIGSIKTAMATNPFMFRHSV